MEEIKQGKLKYRFIEVMSCPAGCINGSGQLYIKAGREKITNRMKAIYNEDKGNSIRKSHENPFVIELYKENLGKPNSHLAHELLHKNIKNNEKY